MSHPPESRHVIRDVLTDEERQQVSDLFQAVFQDIDPTAVPMSNVDHIYAPLIVACWAEPGELLGAALTCRAQVATTAITAAQLGLPAMGYESVADKHSELDLMAVRPKSQGEGIGASLVQYLEPALRARGVRVWFGNATPELDTRKLRRFYERLGFTVLDDGQRLPPLLGKEWTMPNTKPPAFYFYKLLR